MIITIPEIAKPLPLREGFFFIFNKAITPNTNPAIGKKGKDNPIAKLINNPIVGEVIEMKGNTDQIIEKINAKINDNIAKTLIFRGCLFGILS